MSNRPPARYQRGSCICEAHELRITQRCLVEDLGYDAMSTFADASSHPIVRAFENQRSGNPIGTKTVGPAAGERTLYRIGYGHNHRGATWYDPPNRRFGSAHTDFTAPAVRTTPSRTSRS